MATPSKTNEEDITRAIQNQKRNSVHKKFLWDEALYVLALVSGTLVFVALGQGIVMDNELSCAVPTRMSRDQARFVEQWCYASVSAIDGMPLLLFVQGLVIAGPHLIWEALAEPALQQFFSMTMLLERLRDRNTGQYSFMTMQVVRKLMATYRGNHRLHRVYSAKLVAQLLTLAGFFAWLLYILFESNQFQEDFLCPNVANDTSRTTFQSQIPASSSFEEHLPLDVLCTYNKAFFMRNVWIIDFIVVAAATGAGVAGFYWYKKNHWKQLDYSSRANFLYSFSMNRGSEKYSPSKDHKHGVTLNNDLDFLLLLLFNKDNGKGETFFDALVDIELEERWGHDTEAYASYRAKLFGTEDKTTIIEREVSSLCNRNSESDAPDEKPPDARWGRCLLGEKLLQICFRQGKDRVDAKRRDDLRRPFTRGLHLFCGSKGCTLMILRLCKEMMAVDLNYFYQPVVEKLPLSSDESRQDRGRGSNVSAPVRKPDDVEKQIPEEIYSNLKYIRVPWNITSKEGPEQAPLNLKLRKAPDVKYDLIIITCLEPHFRSSAARVILENIFWECTEDGCLVLFVADKKGFKDIEEALASVFVYCDDLSPWKPYEPNCSDASVELRIMTTKFRISKFKDRQL